MSERNPQTKVNPDEILARHAANAGTTVDVLIGRSRRRNLAQERAEAQVEMREVGMTLKEIGRRTNRHHATVIYSLRKDTVAGENVQTGELPTLSQQYLDANFSGIQLENLQSPNNSRRFSVPRYALERYLFYDLGAYINQIREILPRDHSTIAHTINISEEEFAQRVEAWKQSEARRIRLEEIKKAGGLEEMRRREKEKQEKQKEKRERRNTIFADTTLKIVADHYLVSVDEMLSKSRIKTFSQPRKTAQFILYKGAGFSYKTVAEIFGRKDHTSAMHSVATVERRMNIDPEFKERIEELFVTINRLTDKAMQSNENPEPVIPILPSI